MEAIFNPIMAKIYQSTGGQGMGGMPGGMNMPGGMGGNNPGGQNPPGQSGPQVDEVDWL